MRAFLLALSLTVCFPGVSRAEMRIRSVDPPDPRPGWTLDLIGVGFGTAPNGRVVEIYRIVDREPVFYRPEVLRWSHYQITVGIQRTVPPSDDYAVRIHVPGRFIASNSVRLTVRQPPPRADHARVRLVAESRCDTRGRTRNEGGREEWSGGLYACDNPLHRITSRASAVSVGERVETTGEFGNRQPNQVLALMEVQDGRLYVRHLLRIHRWTPGRIEWEVTDNIESDNYALGLLYRLPVESGSLVFERGSNIVHLYVR